MLHKWLPMVSGGLSKFVQSNNRSNGDLVPSKPICAELLQSVRGRVNVSTVYSNTSCLQSIVLQLPTSVHSLHSTVISGNFQFVLHFLQMLSLKWEKNVVQTLCRRWLVQRCSKLILFCADTQRRNEPRQSPHVVASEMSRWPERWQLRPFPAYG